MLLYNRIIEVRSVHIPYHYIYNEQIPFTNIFYTFQRYILQVLLTTKQRMRVVCWNKRSLVVIRRYRLLPCRHGGHPRPPTKQTIHRGRTLSYIIDVLLFCHYLLWIIKILPWRPRRNVWFRRGSQSVNIVCSNGRVISVTSIHVSSIL